MLNSTCFGSLIRDRSFHHLLLILHSHFVVGHSVRFDLVHILYRLYRSLLDDGFGNILGHRDLLGHHVRNVGALNLVSSGCLTGDPLETASLESVRTRCRIINPRGTVPLKTVGHPSRLIGKLVHVSTLIDQLRSVGGHWFECRNPFLLIVSLCDRDSFNPLFVAVLRLPNLLRNHDNFLPRLSDRFVLNHIFVRRLVLCFPNGFHDPPCLVTLFRFEDRFVGRHILVFGDPNVFVGRDFLLFRHPLCFLTVGNDRLLLVNRLFDNLIRRRRNLSMTHTAG